MEEPTKQCEHQWEYKETIVIRRYINGEPADDDLYAIFFCKYCNQVKKELIN